MGVAVAAIVNARLAVAAVNAFGQPHLADAALHLVLRRMLFLRQRLQRAAELDDIAVAVVPLVQQLEIVPDFVDGHDGPRSVANTGLYRVPDDQKRWKWNRFLAQIWVRATADAILWRDRPPSACRAAPPPSRPARRPRRCRSSRYDRAPSCRTGHRATSSRSCGACRPGPACPPSPASRPCPSCR